ncbi:DUF1015 family protein [Saccharomonospora saliphila]|uniref:DUF1015 family protein n=1 Tax=Saccharomonospora saliphila TaxID=369829 RepID=UPI0003804517|nr:DUF1015 family protein [Saccharomonospora saliphila]
MSAAHERETTAAPQPRHGASALVRPGNPWVITGGDADEHDGPLAPSRIARLRSEGVLRRPPGVVVYRLESGGHRQTGVVVDVSVDAYRNGAVRRHEATDPDRERRLAEFAETTKTEQVPVMLMHSPRASLEELLDEVTTRPPEVRLAAGNGPAHSVWFATAPALVRAIHHELAGIGTCYIADGHHRMAAAARYSGGPTGTGADDAARTLAALFPSARMRILGYHRYVTLPPGRSVPDLLGAIAAQPVTAHLEECSPTEAVGTEPGVAGLHLHGHWYRLWLRPQTEREDDGADAGAPDARAALDVVALDEGILAPVLGIGRVDADAGVTPFHDDENPAEIHRWCAEHDAMAFLLHPPTVEQVMAVADAGAVMPPKSTFFTPKACAGLFVRELA